MPSRKPRKDDAPECDGKDCHSCKMDIIEKHGMNWHFRCPKCGYICTANSCKPIPKAMKEFMREGRKKKEEPPKPAEVPK